MQQDLIVHLGHVDASAKYFTRDWIVPNYHGRRCTMWYTSLTFPQSSLFNNWNINVSLYDGANLLDVFDTVRDSNGCAHVRLFQQIYWRPNLHIVFSAIDNNPVPTQGSVPFWFFVNRYVDDLLPYERPFHTQQAVDSFEFQPDGRLQHHVYAHDLDRIQSVVFFCGAKAFTHVQVRGVGANPEPIQVESNSFFGKGTTPCGFTAKSSLLIEFDNLNKLLACPDFNMFSMIH